MRTVFSSVCADKGVPFFIPLLLLQQLTNHLIPLLLPQQLTTTDTYRQQLADTSRRTRNLFFVPQHRDSEFTKITRRHELSLPLPAGLLETAEQVNKRLDNTLFHRYNRSRQQAI